MAVVEEIREANPEWTVSELLDDVVRKRVPGVSRRAVRALRSALRGERGYPRPADADTHMLGVGGYWFDWDWFFRDWGYSAYEEWEYTKASLKEPIEPHGVAASWCETQDDYSMSACTHGRDTEAMDDDEYEAWEEGRVPGCVAADGTLLSCGSICLRSDRVAAQHVCWDAEKIHAALSAEEET